MGSIDGYDILEAKSVRNDTVIRRLTNQILDMQEHSMKNNIIFTFDKKSRDFCQEADGENCSHTASFPGQCPRYPGRK